MPFLPPPPPPPELALPPSAGVRARLYDRDMGYEMVEFRGKTVPAAPAVRRMEVLRVEQRYVTAEAPNAYCAGLSDDLVAARSDNLYTLRAGPRRDASLVLVYDLLCHARGVGPRLAKAIVSGHGADGFVFEEVHPAPLRA